MYQFTPSGVYSLLLAKFQISQKRPYMFKHIQSVRILLEDKCQLGACHRVTRAPQAMAITHWAPCADTTIGFAHSHHNCLAHSYYSCLAHSHCFQLRHYSGKFYKGTKMVLHMTQSGKVPKTGAQAPDYWASVARQKQVRYRLKQCALSAR